MIDELRVIDLTTIIAGPICARTLAAMGADVIKIDPPGERPLWFPHLHIDAHRGKRHVALDLKHPRGRALFLRLAATADVVVENARRGTWDRLGIGYDALSTARPELVRVSVRLYSGDGDRSQWPGYETTAQAVSGLATRFGGAEGPPRRAGGGAPNDFAAGLLATFAAIAAVAQARRTGRGRRVETSLVSAATLYQSLDLDRHQPPDATRGVDARGPAPESQLWPASDGWVYAVLRGGALERWRDALHIGSLDEAELTTVARTCDELIATAQRCGGVAVRAMDDDRLRAQLAGRGRFRTTLQPAWGAVSHAGYPAIFTPAVVDEWRPAPAWGEHTREVLETLDVGETEMASLYAQRVVE